MRKIKLIITNMALFSVCCIANAQNLICVDTITDGTLYFICGNNLKVFTNNCPAVDCFWSGPGVSSTGGTDTITITNTGTTGSYIFDCNGGSPSNHKDWDICFATSLPVNILDTAYAICTEWVSLDLNAGNVCCRRLWDNGLTTYHRLITDFGNNYFVDISNGCGTIHCPFKVYYSNPNKPDLGNDTIICQNQTPYILNPNVLSPASTYWSSGESTTNLPVSETNTYWVHVTDINGCDGRDTVNVEVIIPETIEMCYVTFDTVTWKNEIVWYFDINQTEVDSVLVEVKDIFGVFSPIGTVAYNFGYYIHTNSNPLSGSNEYRVTAIGPCGKGQVSSIHRSVWLTTLSSELQWQNYYGSLTPLYYIIYAKMNSGALIPVDTVPSCSGAGCLNHSPIISNPNIANYLIAFQQSCDSNKTIGSWVLSNYLNPSNGIEEQIKGNFNVYPNPFANELIIEIEGNTENTKFEIFNSVGQKVLGGNFVTKTVVQTKNLASGIYLVKLVNGNTFDYKKIIKE